MKISQMTAAGTLTGAELMEIVQSANTRSTTLNALIALAAAKDMFINAVGAGVVSDGVTDSSAQIQTLVNNNPAVYFPAGNYRLNSPVTVPNGCMLLGAGMGKTVFQCAGSKAFTTSPEARLVVLRDFSVVNYAGASGALGVELLQARHCRISRVEVNDFSTSGAVAIKLDGKSTWCASNMIDDILLGRNYGGLLLTADEFKQCNHTQVIGGYIYGSAPIKALAGSFGVKIQRGDTNYFFGCAVEDLAIGYSVEATDGGGQTLVAPRVEACTVDYSIDPGVSNLIVMGMAADLDEDNIGGAGDGMLSITTQPYMKMTKMYLGNNEFLRFKDSGGLRTGLIGVSTTDNLELLTPTFNSAKAIVLKSRSDGTTMASFAKGVTILSQLPTSDTGLPSGALWRDAAAGNVIKMVP